MQAAHEGGLFSLVRLFDREGDALTGCLFAAFLITLADPCCCGM